MPRIEIESASKRYGAIKALDSASFVIEDGEIWGLLGRNGAGKTTLMKSIVGLVRLNSGKICIGEENAWDLSPGMKERIGYAPQIPDLIDQMTARKMLAYTSAFYPTWDSELAERLISEWNLSADVKISTLSPGNVEKISIIIALCNQPDMLILDEPAASMDPEARRSFMKTIASLVRERKRTVLFSTHIVSDIERVADHIAIIDAGKILYAGSMEGIPNYADGKLEDAFLLLLETGKA
jgi:ABC-2 type transport system ATP-binding protein